MQDSPFVADAAESPGDAVRQPAEAGEADVAEFDILEVVSEAIDRIQFRRIARQPLQLQACCRALSQKGPDRRATLGRQAVPDDQQFARNLAQQMLQKADDAPSVEGLTLQPGRSASLLA